MYMQNLNFLVECFISFSVVMFDYYVFLTMVKILVELSHLAHFNISDKVFEHIIT